LTKEKRMRFGPQVTGRVMRFGMTEGAVAGGPQPSTLPAGGWIAGQAAELLATGEAGPVGAGAGDPPALHAAVTSARQSVTEASPYARTEIREDMERSVARHPGGRRREG
jgi:hypothetical protein